MKKITVFSRCFILVTILCMAMTSCNTNIFDEPNAEMTKNTESQVTEDTAPQGTEKPDQPSIYDNLKVDDYTLNKKDGKHYIVFDDISKYSGQDFMGSIDASLNFENLEAFKNAVVNGKLDNWQKAYMVKFFPKDENGILSCDFDNLVEPCLPNGWSITWTGWYGGNSFGFQASNAEEERVSISILTKESFDAKFERNYVNFIDKTRVNVTETTVTEDGKTITKFNSSTAESMSIMYTRTVNGKTCFINEVYLLKSSLNFDTPSDTIPLSVRMYFSGDGEYHHVFLNDFAEKPTEEWLLTFDIQPYVDNNAVEK